MMLNTIYITCPRGHHYRVGRMTPGVVLRMRGRCPVCADFHITTGVVTPFGREILQLRAPNILTDISSGQVRRALRHLSERPDIARLLGRIPQDPAHLSVHDVLFALEGWMRHHGRPGAILPERNHTVEIVAETNDPTASIAYLRNHRTNNRSSRQVDRRKRRVHSPLDRIIASVQSARDQLPLLLESFSRELRRLSLRLTRP